MWRRAARRQPTAPHARAWSARVELRALVRGAAAHSLKLARQTTREAWQAGGVAGGLAASAW
jgi:hypothetical protein